WREADYYFTQVWEKHNKSEVAEKALQLAIISKQRSTGGSDYDGRKCAEARVLVDSALRNFPAMNENNFLTNQLTSITLQQAEKDFKMAEFWQRTGHPGAALFYYEIVIRRYPGSKFDEKAAKARDEILAKLDKEPPPTEPSPTPRIKP